jgi:hypothetical protein
LSQLVLMIWAPLALAAPARAPGIPGSHEDYVREVKSAGSAAFRRALAVYDNYLARSPGDAVAAVERCKFIAATIQHLRFSRLPGWAAPADAVNSNSQHSREDGSDAATSSRERQGLSRRKRRRSFRI